MTAVPAVAANPSEPLPRKGAIERLLSPIADVRPGEAVSALLMALTMFVMLGGYYLLKTAREGFILSEGGAEVKSYASAGQAVMLLVLVPLYGALASRINRTQLVQWVTLFFVSNIALFLMAVSAGINIGVVFFLWFGVFNVMVIAQFWAFAADLYTEEQGKRLFPLIGVGSSLGAWLGAMRAAQVVEQFGPARLLLGGATALILCVVLMRVADAVTQRESKTKAEAAVTKLAAGPSGFRMIASDPYLLLIAMLVLLLNVVNTTGEYLFGRYVVDAATALHGAGPEAEDARQRFIGEAYGSYYSTINLVGFLLQMFVVSRVIKFIGVGRSLLIHPIVALSSYVLMWRAPSFDAIRVLKIADNSINYSLGNTSLQALWLPTTRETKYKAKQAVDSFCVRTGDVVQAGIVYAGGLTALSISGFAAVNMVFACVWLAVVAGLKQRLHLRAQRTGGSEL